MINPGSTVGTAFNKSAMTRFNNTKSQAARMAMPHNQAAQAALRKQTSKSKPGGPPAGSPDPGQLLQGLEPPQPVALPTGGPQMPLEQTADFDPEVFKDELLNEVVGSIRQQQFIESPQVKDAATSVRLKNWFNGGDPARVEDPRNLLQQVISRARLAHEDAG
jgi:hypothetical protein